MCKAFEETRTEGYQMGRAEGRAEGVDEQAKKTAKNLFSMGMKPSEIATVLEQSLSKVREWLSVTAL